MTDHNSPEAVEARKNQEDPIKMYLIVRESLGMSAGKIAAQCGHAVQILERKFNKLEKELDEFEKLEETFGSLTVNEAVIWDKLQPIYYIYNKWLESSFRKVVLRADDKEWAKLKEEFKDELTRVIVVDAGLTEIAPNSETVIGLWPMYENERPKLVKRLQVLK